MYLNVTEVESALVALASTYPSICALITLPNPSIEGRTSHALRLGTQPAGSVPAFYITGGVHAREWGSADILVNLATDLCAAYTANSSLAYGNRRYSAAEIRALMEQTNVLVFPCVNPDGRFYSQNTNAMWRKNRNPADSGGSAGAIGVDINRNQDFVWDFRTAFAPGAFSEYLASDNPASDTYHGHAHTSEPETRNIVSIHDTHPVRWYVDLHSYSEDVLYMWGDDESQTTDPDQNFDNPSHDHQRGLIGGGYAEYIPDADQSEAIGLAAAFSSSLAQVRGKLYAAKSSFSLYPTSGTNGDYAYSRHLVDASKTRSMGFTVEWGTEFQPPWAEMQAIIKDVCAGLIGMGLKGMGVDSFIVSNRDTFSSYEVETTNTFPSSFYVIYDGFSPHALAGAPAISFVDATNGASIGSMTATLAATQYENPGDMSAVQRITHTFDVHFSDGSAFTSETREAYALATYAGMQDAAPVHLIRQPNPYMLDGAVSWLSTDVRVFQLRPGQKIAASNVTLADPNSNTDAPYQFIQALLTEMRSNGNGVAQGFEQLSQDEEGSRLELSRTVDGHRVLNFAVAKVRYRANTQDAVGVRVFFRMFNAMVSDLTYDMRATSNVQNYRRTANGNTALIGINRFFSGAGNQITSIPFFAERRINSATQSMTTQTDGTNVQNLVHAGATEAVAYFGCWLDFNQTEPQFPIAYPSSGDGPFGSRLSILELVRGLHQCLVAEVRFQPGATDPISLGATPAASNRLSQRNLAIVESDNPGSEASHVVQHTLQVKPTTQSLKLAGASVGSRLPMNDELVFRWNGLPTGTLAELYFPDFSADEILALAASRRPGPELLIRIDSHTVGCDANGILFLPLPMRANAVAPGLLTLRLPTTVRTGQTFRVDVEQHSGQLIDPPRRGDAQVARAVVAGQRLTPTNLSRRKVLGAFRMSVLVKEGPPLLKRAVRNLAVLKYIRAAIPAGDSWRPVFDRYVFQLGGQVDALGADPNSVGPSADDPGTNDGGTSSGEGRCYEGRIGRVFYDCNGDFEGFTLDGCCDAPLRFDSREPAIGRLVMNAGRERHRLTICTCKNSKRIETIVIRCD